MPYGTVSQDTRTVLTPEQLAWCERGVSWRVDVIYGGALDESFNVDTFGHAALVAALLAEDLRTPEAIESGWTVSVYDDTSEPPALYWEQASEEMAGATT